MRSRVGSSSWVGGLHWGSWWRVGIGLVGLWLACLDGHDWGIWPVGELEDWSLSGTAAVSLGCAWLGSGGTSVTLGEGFLASGSGGTGLWCGLVLLLEEILDGTELGLSGGNGGSVGGLVGIVFGVSASGKCLIIEALLLNLSLALAFEEDSCSTISLDGFLSVVNGSLGERSLIIKSLVSGDDGGEFSMVVTCFLGVIEGCLGIGFGLLLGFKSTKSTNSSLNVVGVGLGGNSQSFSSSSACDTTGGSSSSSSDSSVLLFGGFSLDGSLVGLGGLLLLPGALSIVVGLLGSGLFALGDHP